MRNRESFIAENLGLVHSCCHRFTGRGIEYDDLFGAGCIGLIKAVDGFDEGRGLMFSTYAVPVILGEVRRLFRDGGAVKVGRTLKEKALRASRMKTQLQNSLGYEPSISELASALELTAEETAEALTAIMPPVSLTFEDEEKESQMDIAVDSGEELLSDRLALREVVGALEERDRELIILRYFGEKTQTQTAQRLGMTQVQVSRREKVILGELKKKLSQ